MRRLSILSPICCTLMALALMLSMPSCKTQKKVVEKKVEVDKYKDVKDRLRKLLADNSMSIEDKEKALNELKSMNIADPEVTNLLSQFETKLTGEKAEKEKFKKEQEERDRIRRAEEEKKKQVENLTVEQKLDKYITGITTAASAEKANALIKEAQQLFTPDADVLTVVYQNGDDIDYDKPQKINQYLNYLKDVKKYNKRVKGVKFDASGKIKELELK